MKNSVFDCLGTNLNIGNMKFEKGHLSCWNPIDSVFCTNLQMVLLPPRKTNKSQLLHFHRGPSSCFPCFHPTFIPPCLVHPFTSPHLIWETSKFHLSHQNFPHIGVKKVLLWFFGDNLFCSDEIFDGDAKARRAHRRFRKVVLQYSLQCWLWWQCWQCWQSWQCW